jgi:hypothetical protein
MTADGQVAPRVLFSCVSENKPDWFDRVANLALSVRKFGGSLADADIVINFVGGADPGVRSTLAALDTEVRVVERFDQRTPYANKLRMLEMVDDHHFDILIALDCDVLVVGDLTPHLTSEHVAAKPADRDRLTDQQWDAFFGALGVPPAEKSVVATSSGTPMRPYFNSGAVFVPARLCKPLLASWAGFLDDILVLLQRRPELVPPQWHIHADQFSLAAALLRDQFPMRALPLSLNFPTHIASQSELVRAAGTPLILHYHKDMDCSGFIMRSRAGVANPLIAAFNGARATHFGVPDPGLPEVPVRIRARRVAVRGVQRLRGYRQRFGTAMARGPHALGR